MSFPTRQLLVAAIAAGIWVAEAPGQVQVQVQQNFPRFGHETGRRNLYRGRLRDAVQDYRKLSNQMRQVPGRIWIDVICYDAMLGESLYQSGDLDGALAAYRSALDVAAQFPAWLDQVNFGNQAAIASRGPAAALQTPWGSPKGAAVLGKFPDQFMLQIGDPNAFLQLQGNAGARLGQFVPVEIAEVIRCTSLALRRMGDLLGPLAEDDPSLSRVLGDVVKRPGPQNHWSEAWVDLLIGSAYFGSGKYVQAKQHLQAAELVEWQGSQLVHPLTAEAEFMLGRIAWEEGNPQNAGLLFEEASYFAAEYDDWTVLEESLRWAYASHARLAGAAPYATPAAAGAWAERQGLDFVYVSSAASDVDSAAARGQNVSTQVRTLTRAMRRGRYPQVLARLGFAAARGSIAAGRLDDARGELADAVVQQSAASTSLLRMRVVDEAYRLGKITSRRAMDLYELVLAPPDEAAWSSDPLDCLVRLMADKSNYFGRWFAATIDRNAFDDAFAVADRAKREHFLGATQLGGRLFWLRHALTAPAEAVDDESMNYRKGVFALAPRLAAINQECDALRRSLDAVGAEALVGDDQDAAKQLARLTELAGEQELILRQIALQRVPSPRPSPRIVELKPLQRSLAGGQAVIAFAAVGPHVVGFFVTRDEFKAWPVSAAGAAPARTAAFLQQLGLTDANREVADEVLEDDSWRSSGAQLLELLLGGETLAQLEGVTELTIVPDGFLWYVPFEALCVNDADGELVPLIERMPVRYMPTIGFALGDGRGRRRTPNRGLILGKLHPQEDGDAVERSLAAWTAAAPGVVELSARDRNSRIPARSIAPFIHHLIVDEDLPPLGDDLDFSLLRVGLRNQTRASGLFQSPWGAPEVVLAPGFHTAAERGLAAARRPTNGDDLFVPATTLLASGTQTVLLARWRTGGDSARELMRNFETSLDGRPPAEAWRETVLASWQRELDPEQEPRLRRRRPGDPPVVASHPFFWAGYALVDRAAVRPTDVVEEAPLQNDFAPAAPVAE